MKNTYFMVYEEHRTGSRPTPDSLRGWGWGVGRGGANAGRYPSLWVQEQTQRLGDLSAELEFAWIILNDFLAQLKETRSYLLQRFSFVLLHLICPVTEPVSQTTDDTRTAWTCCVDHFRTCGRGSTAKQFCFVTSAHLFPLQPGQDVDLGIVMA